MDFGALPPEINSGRMYTGPGAGPMLAAAGAWDSLATELGLTATGYNSVLAELTGGPWIGPAAQSMTAAATPYVSWLSSTAAQAEQTASQARAAAAAYEAAFAMTVPPPVVAANRALLMALVATNFFGQNTPAIMATEAHYGEMWAQDAAAMYGYAGASASASTVTPFNAPPQTTNPAGDAGQAAAVAKTSVIPQALQHVSSASAATTTSTTDPPTWIYQQISGLSSANRNTLRYMAVGLPYFSLGMVQSFASYAQQLVPGSAGGAGAAGSAPLPGTGLPSSSGIGGATTPVSASVGEASAIGRLSVPASWAAGSPEVNPTTALSSVNSTIGATSEKSGAGGLLRGIPLTGAGRQAAGGYTHRYGFRYAVMTRPPSAG